MFKIRPYKDSLTMGKEKLNSLLAGSKAKKAQKKAEALAAALEETIVVTETKLEEACTAEEIDFEQIIYLLDDLELTKRKLKQFKKIITEMFPSK